MPYTYNANPGTQSGSGTFGAVPGPISLPSPFSDLANVYPNLSGTNNQVSSVIGSQLSGNLSPEVLANLQNQAAQFGVANGQPGSNAFLGSLANNKNLLGNIRTTEAMQQAGLQNYNSLIPTIAGTQTVNPALQAGIAGTNAVTSAMPNPADAASYAKQLFDQYLNQMGGPGGGTGAFAGGGGYRPPWYTGGTGSSGGGGGYSIFSSIPGSGDYGGLTGGWSPGPNPTSYLGTGGQTPTYQGGGGVYQSPFDSYNDGTGFNYGGYA